MVNGKDLVAIGASGEAFHVKQTLILTTESVKTPGGCGDGDGRRF
jgi:hypothetical protein